MASVVINVVGGLYSKYCGIALLWRFQAALLYVLYFALGYVYRKHESQCGPFQSIKNICLMILIYCLILVQFHKNTAVNDSIGDVVISTVGVALIVILSGKIEHCKVLEFIGQNTLVYYAFQSKFIKVFELIATKIGFNADDILVCIGVTVLTALLLCVPSVIVKKYFPFLLGRRLSSRRKAV